MLPEVLIFSDRTGIRDQVTRLTFLQIVFCSFSVEVYLKVKKNLCRYIFNLVTLIFIISMTV